MHAGQCEPSCADCGVVHGHVFPYSPAPARPPRGCLRVPPPRGARNGPREVRAAVAANAGAHGWQGLMASPREVLAERDGTGHSARIRAAYRLPAGHSRRARLLTLIPTRITRRPAGMTS